MRTIHCAKLNKDLEGLDFAPLPGQVGQKIYDTISKQAWQMWVDHQTILINEYRLNLMDPKSKEMLLTEMDKFLFGEGVEKPDAFVDPNS